MIDTLPIFYNGGAYGTYVEWCLTTLCSSDDIISPFTNTGTSHKFFGHQIVHMDGWADYLKSDTRFQFVRMHPKIIPGEKIAANLDEIAKSVSHFVYVYPDNDSVVLTVNNFYHKIWEDWWYMNITRLGQHHQIYTNWPVDPGVPLDQIDPWIKREFLSLYLMPAWHELNDWYLPDHYQTPQCIWVSISDLLHDFESTMERIIFLANLPQVRAIADLLPYHQDNLALQKHIDQDQICQRIISSVVENQPFAWDPLPLPSEAWLQWQLRNLGWEMHCHGLDMFPQDSVQLQKTLYQP